MQSTSVSGRRRSLAVLLSFALLSFARGAEVPITIAMLFPSTDPGYLTGVEAREGASLALEELKPTFKRLGFELRLETFDDKRSPDEGRKQAQRILEDPSILAVVGAMNSSVTLAASEVLATGNVGMVSPKSTNPLVTERGLLNVNRIVARDDAQAGGAVDFLVDQLDLKSALVMTDTSTYGKGLFNQFKAAADSRGLKVTGYYNEKTDFTRVIADIQQDKPNVVYYAGTSDVGVPFLKAIRAAKLDVVFMGADGIDNDQFRQGAGKDAVGVYHTGIAAPPAAYPRANTFIARFKKTFGKNPDVNQVLGYDAFRVVAQAIVDAVRRNGNLKPSREAVEKALRQVTVRNLITGEVKFNSAGDRINASMFVLKVGEDLVSRVSASLVVKLSKK